MASNLTSQQRWNRNHKASIAKANHRYYLKHRKPLKHKRKNKRTVYYQISHKFINHYANHNQLKDLIEEAVKKL